MRVAVYIDGSNFYRGLERTLPGREIDYDALADWLVDQVSGDDGGDLVGARYYTGAVDREALGRFLDELGHRRGYLVREHHNATAEGRCPRCHHQWLERREKAVDTAIVADLVLHASKGAFDAAVLLSGDLDLLPGVQIAQDLGRPVWVASWGGAGLSDTLRAAAFDHLDLAAGAEAFLTGRLRTSLRSLPGAADRAGPDDHGAASLAGATHEDDAAVLREVDAAARYFGERGGHLARRYFEQRWAGGPACPEAGPDRVAAVRRLLDDGELQTYRAVVNGRRIEALCRPGAAGPGVD